jgi:hypothetical protein
MRNSIANALEVIGVLVFIGGFIVGIALGNIYPTDNYSDNFNTLLLFETWITSFIIGMMFLGFAELIEQNFRSAEFLSYLVDASRTNAMNNIVLCINHPICLEIRIKPNSPIKIFRHCENWLLDSYKKYGVFFLYGTICNPYKRS